ncbi:alcohol dehydrogenase, partial [Enterococcus faecium]
SLKKMEDGIRLGASDYRATSDRATIKELRGRFDLIINTVSANLNLADYLNLLKRDGTLVELGMPEHQMQVPAGSLIFGRRSIAGSL